MATLELRGVSKRFGKNVALEEVDLRVEDNEFFCVFGPPSCGKTTVLRLLLGLVQPDQGRILIDGKDVTDLPPRARNLGMVFQNLALFPHLTAGGNIAFPLAERKVDKAAIQTRVQEVAAKLQIGHLLKKWPGQLSGGERQRVAIARSLVRDPQAYLMDEPIAALDARLRESTRVELKRLQRELNHTLVYVTHDQEEAMSVADRVAIMREGRICQVGAPGEVYNAPQNLFVAQIVGSPRVNEIAGRVDQRRFEAKDLPVAFDVSSAHSGPVVVAVRPEDLGVGTDGSNEGDGAVFTAKVYEVEPLGGHTVVDLAVGETILRAYLAGQPRFTLGQELPVRLDARHCHLFDATTGALLISGH